MMWKKNLVVKGLANLGKTLEKIVKAVASLGMTLQAFGKAFATLDKTFAKLSKIFAILGRRQESSGRPFSSSIFPFLFYGTFSEPKEINTSEPLMS